MPRKKKQHYVPKFYLKRFTSNERQINLYNLKSRRKIIGASLSGQCYKDYMYGKDGQTENALSLIEGETSKLFKQIDEIISLPKPLTEQHLTMLLHILNILRVGHRDSHPVSSDSIHGWVAQNQGPPWVKR